MPEQILKKLERVMDDFVQIKKGDQKVNAIGKETLRLTTEKGGKKLLDIKSRNEAIELMKLHVRNRISEASHKVKFAPIITTKNIKEDMPFWYHPGTELKKRLCENDRSRSCENPNTCRNNAHQKLSYLMPKWDPRNDEQPQPGNNPAETETNEIPAITIEDLQDLRGGNLTQHVCVFTEIVSGSDTERGRRTKYRRGNLRKNQDEMTKSKKERISREPEQERQNNTQENLEYSRTTTTTNRNPADKIRARTGSKGSGTAVRPRARAKSRDYKVAHQSQELNRRAEMKNETDSDKETTVFTDRSCWIVLGKRNSKRESRSRPLVQGKQREEQGNKTPNPPKLQQRRRTSCGDGSHPRKQNCEKHKNSQQLPIHDKRHNKTPTRLARQGVHRNKKHKHPTSHNRRTDPNSAKIMLRKVKGHSGDTGNDGADAKAAEGANKPTPDGIDLKAGQNIRKLGININRCTQSLLYKAMAH
ncbi:hypothetical protein CC1G_12492 [Coprinopsis cinerea okayama7|uniref:Uncharacterized protein n=1 Tax=Coprinopsis cinerea (strain Okayama-7 / 130 / ATCC MYA-4618 / FGSC 9003) TaxID=240176 RepID=A8P2T8_COPC7|nr:hypothetical protein CC1G_12492 [Coprinopsis cinerea okayama7\|eukprot:XP_001838400.2 hypothetical protein CC1G_12492 [Coprinopsis cinerea okayama7\